MRFPFSVRVLLFFVFGLSCCSAAADTEVARLHSAEGVVEVQQAAVADWRVVQEGAVFRAGDALRVGRHSRAGVLFADGMLVRLGSRTTIRFKPADKPDSPPDSLSVKSGRVHLFSRAAKHRAQIDTPVVSAAVRGTEFGVEVNEDSTTVSVIDGVVECGNQYGTVRAHDGEQVVAVRGAAPLKQVLLQPFDAVQWTFRYPVVLTLDDYADFIPGASAVQQRGWQALRNGQWSAALKLFIGSAWRDVMGRSLALLHEEGPAAAAEVLDSYSGPQSAGLALYAAGLALASGDVPRARRLLDQSEKLSLAAGAGGAAGAARKVTNRLRAAVRAQQALLTLTVGQQQGALQLAERARALAPRAASVQLALSLVQQSHSDLEAARAAAREAAALEPDNAFVWVRLAELELSFGEVKAAERHIAAAQRLDPELGYAHNVAGFVALFKNETDKAQQRFEAAAAADSSAALSRLGLGLVSMRRGDVQQGRRQIEQAAHLDPRVSLYRSYLGKAFFEEGAEDLAAREYELAIDLDPQDPTPYLYRAFNQLSQNAVVPALRDVEASIERNDNRAVYRSQLMLDKDVAVRGAKLGRVFNQLGFSQAARVEAIKSINRDYANFSAHRLLSDSYRSIVLGDAALSERRLADLLSPLSFNLFQGTSGAASLNEYDALFDKAEQRTGLNVFGDSADDLISGEIFRSGKSDTFGYYASYQNWYGDGSRSGNYFRDNLLRGAVQYQPLYTDRLILEGSYQYSEQRELSDPDFQENDAIGYDVRLGYSKDVSPRAQFLTQLSFEHDRDWAWGNNFDDADIEIAFARGELQRFTDQLFLDDSARVGQRRFRAEVQYIYDSRYLSAVHGVQMFRARVEREQDALIIDDFPGFVFTDIGRHLASAADNDLNSQDAYSYLTLHPAEWVDIDLGLVLTYLEREVTDTAPYVDGTISDERLNPKVGVTLYPLAELMLRAAYFEGLRKSVLYDQATLEPTLVGGINQRFSDLSGGTAKNYGAAIDYKIPGWTYFGAEGLHRDLTTDVGMARAHFTFDFVEMREDSRVLLDGLRAEDVEQDFVSAYLYQVLTRDVVASLDYSYSREDVDFEFDPLAAQEYQTHRVQAALRYFDSSGFFPFARATWRQQDISAADPAAGSSAEVQDILLTGISDFWIVDLGIGYRLPGRHGIITLEATNIFDEDFEYDESLGFEGRVASGAGARLVASVNF